MKRFFYIKMLLILCCTLCCSVANCAQQHDCGVDVEIVEYKKIDTLGLDMMVMSPDNIKVGESRVAIVLIHGGGWNSGNYESFSKHGHYFASKGLVVFAINYRTRDRSKTTPYECLLDAKSAMRFVRANAERFSVDPDRIIAGGGSAGGHLAAAVSMCPNINDENDDLSVSSKACATILFNPVICNGPDVKGKYKGYGYSRVKDYYKDFSPMHNIGKGVAPTIFMVGTEDRLIPVAVGEEYTRLIEEVGGRCDLFLYQGQPHSFYHIKKGRDATYFCKTVTETHNFLLSLGYLEGKPTVEEWLESQDRDYIY